MHETTTASARDLPRTLTRRYVLALALLAVLATGALFVADYVISGYQGNATLVNMAGRQRMLSQRAVLYSDRLSSPSASEREDARRELQNATGDLELAHAALSPDKGDPVLSSMTPGLHRLYFGRADAIDPLLKRFLAATEALSNKSLDGPVSPNDSDLGLVNDIGSGRLLSAFEKAVSYYEAQGEAAVENLRNFEIAAWLSGLIVLISSAFLIFAPTVRRLKENLLETRAATNALAESEERFALAAQGAAVGIRDHFDPQLDEEYWSPQFYRLLGYDLDELAPGRSAFYLILHPDDREPVAQAIERHLQEQAPLGEECRLQHKTQGYRWFLMTGQAIWSEAGIPRRLITSFMDLNERKQAEQMKSEFVSTVAHELRTPVTSIVGALGLMRSKVAGELTEKGERIVSIAQDNCARLVNLINDLLDVEKIESGKIAFDFEAESLSHLLSEAQEQNALYAEQNGATVELKPLDPDVTVDVDKARFAQVMANLISNAAKYSPAGGTITLAAHASGGKVRISVRDRGPGIPAEFRNRIFQRFTQANDTGQKSGTGLGLSIAKAIVEAHGGEIGFDSEEGKCSTFYFDLPLPDAAAGAGSADDHGDIFGVALHPGERGQTARIILVENRAAARAAISLQLGDIAELTTVSHCRDAASLLARRAFDLVVVDRSLLDEAENMLQLVMLEKGRPLPPILVYDEGASTLPELPERMAPFVRQQVDERTLRQTVLDELLRRKTQFAMRFRKSA